MTRLPEGPRGALGAREGSRPGTPAREGGWQEEAGYIQKLIITRDHEDDQEIAQRPILSPPVRYGKPQLHMGGVVPRGKKGVRFKLGG